MTLILSSLSAAETNGKTCNLQPNEDAIKDEREDVSWCGSAYTDTCLVDSDGKCAGSVCVTKRYVDVSESNYEHLMCHKPTKTWIKVGDYPVDPAEMTFTGSSDYLNSCEFELY